LNAHLNKWQVLYPQSLFDPANSPYDFEDPVPTTPDQTTAGNNQWTELVFKVSDLIKIGADSSRSLKNVAAIRIQFQAANTVVVDVDAWWIGGTYGPDVGIGAPYLYCYTGRNKLTGATSNPSPPMRSGVEARRNRIVGTLIQHSDAQVDVLDIYRYGGSLNEWHFVLTTANGATPTFTDDYADDVISANPLLEFDNYQPFPSTDTPKTGTCNVSGTKVTRAAGDNFNTSWGRNSVIKINGVAYTMYASPTSTTVLETNENVGTLSGATFEVPDAVLLGQPLPVMWGPYGGGLGGVFMFGCGDSRLPGTLFITKGNNPDSCNYRLEITSGSEKLVNGCVYDGRPYVFSTERLFAIEPINGGQDWIAREVANSTGLYARWGLVVGDRIYYLGKDGVYESEGGEPRCITDEDFYNLFMHDAGVNTIRSADSYGLTQLPFANPDDIKFGYSNSVLYVDYKNTFYYSVAFDLKWKTWITDVYADSATAVHYGNERGTNVFMGGSNGRVYSFNEFFQDFGSNYTSRITTGFDDCGDSRAEKVFSEIYLDADFGGITSTVKTYINNDTSTALDTFTPTGVSGSRVPTLLDINGGAGRIAKNLGIDIQWSNGFLRLYQWSPSFVPKADKTITRATDWNDLGVSGAKWIQGVSIRADTFNAAKSFAVITDDGQTIGPFSITHNGERVSDISFPSPIIAHLVKIITSDTDPWMVIADHWTFEPEPPLATDWVSQPTSFDLDGFKTLGPTAYITHRSTADLTLSIIVDGTTFSYTIVHGSGAVVKSRVVLNAGLKGKVYQSKITSTVGCRVYRKGSSYEIRSWGASGPYQTVRALGELSPGIGARI
jgi:hypothetical protein